MINNTLEYCELFDVKPSFFRSRIIDNIDLLITDEHSLFVTTGIKGFNKANMGKPPLDKVKSGRCNSDSMSYLYLASDKETACSEVQPIYGDTISVVTYKLDENLKILNLVNMPKKINSISDKSTNDEMIMYIFFRVLIELFSAPTYKDDIYTFSQFISEIYKAKNFDGIAYQTNHNFTNNSANLVLFDDSKAKCIDEYGEVFKCLSSIKTFQSISKSYRTINDVEIITAKRECQPILWNEAALLRQNIYNKKVRTPPYDEKS